MDNDVKVALVKNDTPFKHGTVFGIKLSLQSHVMLRCSNHVVLDPDSPRLVREVEFEAERLAANQCEKFGDRHNPRAVAQAARAALEDVLAAAGRF